VQHGHTTASGRPLRRCQRRRLLRTAGVCIAGGSLTLTAVDQSTFSPSGQDIIAEADYAATLTTIGGTLIGPVNLAGMVEQEVVGRTSATQTGFWTTEILALSLTGPILGHSLTVGLDGSDTSSGSTSITPDGPDESIVNSFFDVFAEVTLDTSPPLQNSRGPIELTVTPESASVVLLGLPLLLLPIARGRRRA
jgi:hypothetical protein